MESYARDNGKVREFPVVVQTDSPLQPASANRGFDLGAHINLLRRRWPIFIGVLCSALLVGGLMVIRATRVYRATATVFIDPHAPEVLSGVREVYDFGGGYWASKEFYQTQYGVIRSHQVAQKVVNNLGLLPEPIASELRGASASLESRAAQDPLHGLPEGLVTKLRLLGVGHLKSRTAMLQALEHMDPATAIQRRILAEPLKDSRLVLISIEDSNPQQAAVLANAVVDAYIETNLDQKADVTRSAVTWLSNQIIDLKRKVEESELALHEFRKANNIVSMSMEDKQTINAQTLSQLNQSLSTARAEGFALGSRRDQIAQAMAAGEIP
ncbi:MAG TPA: hypothetical protein VFH51_00745, partial [Myxococcota bacterium]|nr:hypothetical protein [Myxococcota bacterium]